MASYKSLNVCGVEISYSCKNQCIITVFQMLAENRENQRHVLPFSV